MVPGQISSADAGVHRVGGTGKALPAGHIFASGDEGFNAARDRPDEAAYRLPVAYSRLFQLMEIISDIAILRSPSYVMKKSSMKSAANARAFFSSRSPGFESRS